MNIPDRNQLLDKIDLALKGIQPDFERGLCQTPSLHAQLLWCRGRLLGELVEHAKGPLTMGLIATREYDMWGDQPDLAFLIYELQERFNALFFGSNHVA